ncbi:GNAT family N-acetyltransferase [Paraherbaspirillum soli]|uniref:GNAT family N-acetyltransferase n=1 Tax=Paraherbaspirillum soli TaxID=631222 RepID=A0ABW0M863_9BURK
MQAVDAGRELLAQDLILQPILPSHAAALFADLQAPELYTFIPHSAPESREALEQRYARWAKRQSADGSEIWLNYAIYRPTHSDYVGTVQATLHCSGETYIAYEVFPRHWRQGYARDACTALLAHIFASYPVNTVSALLDTRNEASWKLLESLGFHRTGVIENADEFKGAVSDEYIYEIGRHESAANF